MCPDCYRGSILSRKVVFREGALTKRETSRLYRSFAALWTRSHEPDKRHECVDEQAHLCEVQ